MKTELKHYTVGEIVEGFVYNELEGKGLFRSGRQAGHPARVPAQLHLQRRQEGRCRHRLAAEGLSARADLLQRRRAPPRGPRRPAAHHQRRPVRDRQVRDPARTARSRRSRRLPTEEQAKILDSELLVYECQGTEKEIKEWFQTINIAGVPLNNQELLNADLLRAVRHQGQGRVQQLAEREPSEVVGLHQGRPQASGGPGGGAWRGCRSSQGISIDAYMAKHRQDDNIDELKAYFTSVIDWIGSVFTAPPDKEMRGWSGGGCTRRTTASRTTQRRSRLRCRRLMGDPAVESRKGIYEYLLGGKTSTRSCSVRLFDDKTKKLAYEPRPRRLRPSGVSNCPLCAVGDNSNKTRIYKQNEMDADHVTAWSKGGATDLDNCEMLCVTHNRAKGNK